jgi:signal transduction histidine kinase
MLMQWMGKIKQKFATKTGNAAREAQTAYPALSADNLLDMSKIEAGKLELNPVKYETVSMIIDTVHLNLVKFENKPLVFKLQVDENIPSALYGDEPRIKKILNNLLSHAARHTERGRITLSLSAERYGLHDDIMLVIKVQDNRQFTMDTHAAVGADMEMSITRNLIHAMNGAIFVNSDTKQGNELTVRLPQGNTGSGTLGLEVARNLRQFRQNVKTRIKHPPVIRESMPYGGALMAEDLA